MLKAIVALVVAAHGIGHVLFLIPLLGIADWGQSMRSWLLGTDTLAKIVGGIIWIASMAGFLLAAYGLFSLTDWWRNVAIVSAIVSLVGLILFFANPPSSPVISAAVFNLIILVALLVFNWPTNAALAQ